MTKPDPLAASALCAVPEVNAALTGLALWPGSLRDERNVIEAIRDATLAAHREQLLALTPEAVVEAAQLAMADSDPYLESHSHEADRRIWVRAALPVLLAPEVARREQVERELAAIEAIVRHDSVCPAMNTETDLDSKYVCIGEDGDPIIEAETLAEAVDGVVRCWGRLQNQYEVRVGKLAEANRGIRENNAETNKLRIAAEAERDRLKAALEKYGDHEGDCRENLKASGDCDCGFDAALGGDK